jgi:hypothetical protein
MFCVSEYTGRESIIDGLKKRPPFTELSENHHFNYLENYFQTVVSKTMVFEYEYFDKDYLEDYSRYYSRCFQPYDKKCVRVHFFGHAFKEEDFVEIITNPQQKKKGVEDLQKHYIGFVVFRPIPHTIFGRTCLKAFPNHEIDAEEQVRPEKNRQIPILREYKIHLFGIELSLHSLAYQEQDNAVSACATSALWSAFQSTGMSFHHPIPSPYEITLSAKELISSTISSNSGDNRGLDSKQMAYAIKAVGLEPLLLNPADKDYLKAQVCFVWDIYLSNVCDLKQYFSTCRHISKDNKRNLLTKSFPRYVWVVDAYRKTRNEADEEKLFSFYFDATDIVNGNLFLCVLHYDELSFEMVHASAETLLSGDTPFKNENLLLRIFNDYVTNNCATIFKQSGATK